MTEEEHIKKTGTAPIEDDLERVNCSIAGSPGHIQCGWCYKCDAPGFLCLHLIVHNPNE